MTQQGHVRAVSNFMYWIVSVTFCGLPLVVVWLVVTYVPDRAALVSEYPGLRLPEVVSIGATRLFVAMGLLPWIGAAFTLWQMRRLFQRYRRGEFLSEGCASAIQRIGIGVLVLLVLQVLSHPLKVLALTLPNPEGQRAVAVAFDSSDLALLLTGGLILLIGWVMGEAVQAAEENKSFV